MGLFDKLMGKDTAAASNAAAADTYRKQQAAIGDLKASGQTYATNMTGLADRLSPYADAGTTALTRLMNGEYTASPGLSAAITSALDQNDRRMSSRGMLASGNNIDNTNRIVSDYTLQDFQNWQTQQNTLAGMGQQAAGSQVSTIGQGYSGQLGADTAAFGGAMNAAGTIGQGQIAGAQAEQSALQGLMSAGAYLGGAALGKIPGTSMLGGSNANPWQAGSPNRVRIAGIDF